MDGSGTIGGGGVLVLVVFFCCQENLDGFLTKLEEYWCGQNKE